jgi:hypothetical protein
MFIHFKVHRWVVWWFYIGVACGVVAVVNILNRHLDRTHEEIVLMIGVIHWVLGGVACYFYDSVRIEKNSIQELPVKDGRKSEEQKEWHAASDFLLPGGRQSLLRPRYRP